MTWPKIPQWILGRFDATAWLLAQETHLLIGILVMVFAKAYGVPYWVAGLALMAFVLFKETVIDPWLEGNPFFWSGFIDALFYIAGIGIGLAVIYVANHFGLGHLS